MISKRKEIGCLYFLNIIQNVMMSKKNRNKKEQQSTSHNYIENINVDIDYDKLAKAIVIAQNQVDEDKAKEQEKQKEERLKEWHEIVHYKECPKNSGKMKTILYSIRNFVWGFCVLMTFKRKNAENVSITFNLLRLVTSIMFSIIELFLYYIACLSIRKVVQDQPVWMICVLGSIIFARFFRVATFEIDNMNDRQYIIAIFSAITSFLALVIAVIALLFEVIYKV